MIPIHEIIHTIQGEGLMAGFRCALVRTYGCNLSCRWCDTPQEGVKPYPMEMDEIVSQVLAMKVPVVLVTGGEPLLHSETPLLCRRLLARHLAVIVETNGSIDITVLPKGVVRIMDLKPPSSGFAEYNLLANLKALRVTDEVKIVISGREDYLWAKRMIEGNLSKFPGTIHLSPLMKDGLPAQVARWVIEDRMRVRINLQVQKILFPGGER